MAKVHNMRDEQEKEREGQPVMDAFYKSLFGKYLCKIERVTGESVESRRLQKLGIDVILHLSWNCNGTRYKDKVKIDEKIRLSKWNDFLVEIYSDIERKTPSWIFKPGADYIAYAFLGSKECFILPRLLLLLWTCENKEYLENECERKDIENERGSRKWVTTSYLVPIEKLLSGLQDVQYVCLD